MPNSLLKAFFSFFEKPKKIAIISYHYPYGRATNSGVGTHAYNLVTNLSKLGCEVHVFTSSDKNRVQKINVGNGKVIIHFIGSNLGFDVADPVISKRIGYSLFESNVLNEIIKEHTRRNFSVVHTHGWLTSSAFLFKSLYMVPWVHTVHALERNRLNTMTLEEKRLYKTTSWVENTLVDADKLIAVSEATKRELFRAFKRVSKKVEVIPNGVDLNLFKPHIHSGKKILSVSRFSKEKGVELIPEIVDKVLSLDKSASFTFIAKETQLSSLKKVQDELKLLLAKYPGRFFWVSEPIGALELSGYYRSSDIYIQTSFYETFGLCILEAMASGNVIIASNVGGIPEVVSDSGILVNPNVSEFVSQIMKVLKSKKLSIELAKKAAKRAESFSWKIIAERTLRVYESLSN